MRKPVPQCEYCGNPNDLYRISPGRAHDLLGDVWACHSCMATAVRGSALARSRDKFYAADFEGYLPIVWENVPVAASWVWPMAAAPR